MRAIASTVDAAARAGHAVHGIGIGLRMVSGRLTPDLAVRCYVVQKLPRRTLSPWQRIPPEIDGVPVDVIEASPSVIRAGPFQRQRCVPLRPGVSSGRGDTTFGTLA